MRRALVACAGAAGGVLLSAGPAFGATSGAQSFTLTGNGRSPSVLATGPIHGHGTDHTAGPNHDVFKFAQGNVGIDHAATAQHPGPQAGCTFFYSERGTYDVTGGTGAYAGASGSGTYVLQDVFFAKRKPNGTCSERAGHDVLLISAHGHTTLPS